MGAWSQAPVSAMAGNADSKDKTAALLVETRRRAGLIDRYVDMIPARFYLSSEALAAHKPRNGLDPAQYKTTSQLIMEATAAEAEAAKSAKSTSSTQGKAKNKKAKKEKDAGLESGEDVKEEPQSRADLRKRLEDKIAELKEERRKKQSETDKQAHKADKEKRLREQSAEAAPAKKQRVASSLPQEDVEAGRLDFKPRLADLPFEAQVNRKGNKAKELRGALRKEEAKQRQLDSAKGEDREALRNEFALDDAMRRARGEKVHDDVSRLRKVQKQMDMKKSKGKEKWQARVEADKKQQEDKQTRRKENLKEQRDKKLKNQPRPGFEGKRPGFLGEKSEKASAAVL